MNKKYIILIVFLLAIISILLIIKFVWKGNYINSGSNIIILNLDGNNLFIKSDFGKYSSGEKISFIDSEINTEKKEIFISLYSKYYFLSKPFYKSKDYILLSDKGIYKIYYKNSDGSLDFIKEIEYK